MKKRSLVLALAMLFILSVALTACGPKTPAQETPTAQAEPKVLRYNIPGEPTYLDPQRATSDGEIQVINGLMEGLMRRHGAEINPGLAESYTVSEDGLVYTFKLRDAKWSDGQPVKAGDFEYAWKRALDPALASEYAYILYYIKGAEEYNSGTGTADQVGVKAIDDKTLEVTLKAPAAFFPSLTSFITYYPARKDVVEKYGDKYFAEAQNMVVTGPFTMAKWEHETGMELAKNPNYWNAAAIKLDKVEMTMVNDTNTELNMYLAGDLDFVTALTGEQINQVPAEEVKSYNSGSVWYIAFNQTEKSGIMKNVNIRKALTYAIDRQTFVQAVIKQKDSKPAMAIVHPEIIPGKTKSFREEAGDYFKDNDLEAAKAALAQGLKELGLKQLPTLKFMINDNDSGKQFGQGLQEMWKKNLGIDIELEPVPSGVRIERLHKKDYQIAMAGWGPDYPDAMTDLDMYHSKAGNNDFGYNNPEYDKLIDAARVETDVNKRLDLLFAAEKMLIQDDMVVGPIYFRYRNYAIKPYVTDLVRFPLGGDVDFVFADVNRPAK